MQTIKQMIPPGVPNVESVKAYLDKVHVLPADRDRYDVMVLGIRGYYRDTMGEPGKNDVGIYDDAIVIVSPEGVWTFNGNTDPSRIFPHVAVLKPGGPYLYKIGLHNMKAPYEACRQYGRVTVIRDGKEETDTAAAPFYIDIHRGGFGTTSSLGCQTVYPTEYPNYMYILKSQLNKFSQVVFPYYLAEYS